MASCTNTNGFNEKLKHRSMTRKSMSFRASSPEKVLGHGVSLEDLVKRTHRHINV